MDDAEVRSVPRLRVARVVWGACLGALVGYYAILVLLIPCELVGQSPDLARQLGGILLPVAGAATIFAWFVYRQLAESANAVLAPEDGAEPGGHGGLPSERDQPAMVAYVTCWALGDGIAVLGLVAGVFGGTMGMATIFFVWALLLLFVTRPQAMHFPRARTL